MTNEQREALIAGKPTREAVEAFCKKRWANYGEIVHPNLVQEHIEPAIQAALDIILPLHRELVLEKAQNDLFAPTPRIAELEAAQKWQPIKSAPKDDELILGARGNIAFAISWASEDACWYTFNGWYEEFFKKQFEPTHWMPHPDPLETGDK